ncbi:hypothetical protein ACFL1H_02240 [Nanoarchaeota archaeon]
MARRLKFKRIVPVVIILLLIGSLFIFLSIKLSNKNDACDFLTILPKDCDIEGCHGVKQGSCISGKVTYSECIPTSDCQNINNKIDANGDAGGKVIKDDVVINKIYLIKDKFDLKDNTIIFYHADDLHSENMKPIVNNLEKEGIEFLWRDPIFQDELNEFFNLRGAVPEFVCINNVNNPIRGETTEQNLRDYAESCK